MRDSAKLVMLCLLASVAVGLASESPEVKTSSDSTEKKVAQTLLSKKQLASIKSELAERIKNDQEVRKNKKKRKEMLTVDRDNTKWLKTTIKEVGWIDVDRFGSDASRNAFLIVQHSGDQPLMEEALPQIEKDVKAKKLDAQAYALLYDRLNLRTKGKQKYGTQMGMSKKGALIVQPLESVEKVEQYRKEIGMMPLSVYLSIVKKLYGRTVIFSEDNKIEKKGINKQ